MNKNDAYAVQRIKDNESEDGVMVGNRRVAVCQ